VSVLRQGAREGGKEVGRQEERVSVWRYTLVRRRQVLLLAVGRMRRGGKEGGEEGAIRAGGGRSHDSYAFPSRV